MATLAIASPDSFSDRFYCGIFATESPRPGKDFTGGNRENGGRKGESEKRNAEFFTANGENLGWTYLTAENGLAANGSPGG